MAEAYSMKGSMEENAVDQLIPYYQPVLALDTRLIMGYEALGRVRTRQGMRSLGPFFEDKDVPMGEHIRIDRLLREQALAKFAADARLCEQGMLFLNLKPSWIFQTYKETGELPTLRLLDKYGIDPGRVVIEITEESFQDPLEQLRTVVDVYRKEGCRIAIDDVGSGFSNMDRIALIQPHILKIDIHMLQQSELHSGYYGVLRSFSTLADQIGASLLLEGVESEQDLQRAIEVGARYVQGYLFAPAEPEFLPADSFSGLIAMELERRRSQIMLAERNWTEEAEQLRLIVEKAWRTREKEDCPEEAEDIVIEQILPVLAGSCKRVYICREDGSQVSSNYQRNAGEAWERQTAFRGLNWSWRPYFIPTSVKLGGTLRAAVSRAYTDLDSYDRIRTISLPVGEGRLLFADMIDPEGQS
ncbi:EAL domain-containing protein [Paenibacillus nasutitermitis]|uniref:EAL-domain containing protein YkuI n=1 Tax=Paenibacillus nasutitermitis TaxID=1652958 RepID=A0A916ZHP6_9BACL|nr:EAL domain-containing protein [Paenibacillus nasutitermitis]GGD96622.1 putative EAL-domain containing protein YkuI [Paenibacillus nasutitermitis]